MIQFTRGDILRSESEALVNTVNCVGIMGRGIALQFKNAYPENFKAYTVACKLGQVKPGRMFVFETGQLTPPRYIINFPTKRHWRGKSRIEDIEAGLVDLVAVIRAKKIRSISLPPLGSGLGGLNWDEVRSQIQSALSPLVDVNVTVYEPQGAPSSDTMQHRREVPKMTASRATLIELVQRYLDGLLDPYVTLLEVHKLMYFMQEAGEPLLLKYRRAIYGPYAENLRHVLHAIEGHHISGYDDGGDVPDKQLTLVPGAVEDATEYLANHPETRSRFDRVAALVKGFESPFGLELLASVYWIMRNESVHSLEDVVERTYAWNERKRNFTERQIGIAANVLIRQGWVNRELRSESLPHN
ncbi:MAG TPA: macro domain-containing protein [Nitrospira sp.]|nr:macro domain-containing protein [Nitrospira sp.]HNG02929.1 macro domain-containing protein [Nitrospira sp.]HNJ18305.1 macro domain-containing protein [Nitrospira sp.]HNK49875.1 macro domain-containing protein [Nitrospira sp.]HNM19947.1 macro domain-containing protein [Nitrospira sp.]